MYVPDLNIPGLHSPYFNIQEHTFFYALNLTSWVARTTCDICLAFNILTYN